MIDPMLAVDLAALLEAGMLFCFGFSWPVAIFKTLRTRKVTGKSLGFLVLIFVGYLCGIGKEFARLPSLDALGEMRWLVYLYALNGLMVGTEIVLYQKYRERGGIAQATSADAVIGRPPA